MAVKNELNAAAEVLYSVLSSDTALATAVGTHPDLDIVQVYEQLAPQNSSFPYVVFKSIRDRISRGTSRADKVFSRQTYQILAVGVGDDISDVGAIADRIEELLINHDNVILGVTFRSSIRGHIKRSYVEDGIRYNEMGAFVEVHMNAQV